MTLREALLTVDLDTVYRLINKKDQRNYAACDRPELSTTIAAYTKVVKELLGKPRVRRYSMDLVVKESIDWFDKKPYPDVCFLNRRYVAPKKGLKPWGCKRGQKPPRGHYDVNANKHNQYFAAGMTPWSKIIDTPVVNEAGYKMEKVVAEILWELTFYGWTEDKVDASMKVIKGKLEKAMKEIKQGKSIELPPSEKGGYKIVIPDSVSQQFIDLANKRKK